MLWRTVKGRGQKAVKYKCFDKRKLDLFPSQAKRLIRPVIALLIGECLHAGREVETKLKEGKEVIVPN